MLVIFRADSSHKIGSGHIMRCYALACEFRKKGDTIYFICREDEGNIIEFLEKNEFKVNRISKYNYKYDWEKFNYDQNLEKEKIQHLINSSQSLGLGKPLLIIDHYYLKTEYEMMARSFSCNIMVIEDVPNRHHECDYLLDQNYNSNIKHYKRLTPDGVKFFLGPKFSLIREEFLHMRSSLLTTSNKKFDQKKVLVFFGASDPYNYTQRALQILLKCGDFEPRVVVGQNHKALPQIVELVQNSPGAKIYIQTSEMSEILKEVSWYLGAGGSVTWERMLLGISGVVISVASNQDLIVKNLALDGFHIETKLETVRDTISQIDWKEIQDMNEKCWNFMEDHVGVKEIVEKVKEYI